MEDQLIRSGRALLDEVATLHHNTNDRLARRQALNDSVDAFMRDEVEDALLRGKIDRDARERIDVSLSSYAGRLHNG